MKKSSKDERSRLSTVINPRFDVVAPKKELESAEKQIEKVRKETMKVFESDMEAAMFSGSQVDKSAEALRQLKYLHDCAVQLVKESEMVHKQALSPRHGKHEAGAEEPADNTTQGESKRKISTARSSRPPSDISSTVTTPVEIILPDGERQIVLPDGETQKKFSRAMSDVTTATGSGSDVSSLRKISFKQDSATGSDVGTPGSALPEFHAMPSQAVQIISMVRVMAMGRQLEAKEIKVLTTVIEESRTAVKSVKGGMDPDRAQEKLIKKLNELLDMVKPRGSDLVIAPEELLRCGYLRLSKENVERLEEMIREKGYDPGIHCHSDVSNIGSLMAHTASTSTKLMGQLEGDEGKNLQPVSVYKTKAGAPVDKKRTAKPESAHNTTLDEETITRMKKYKTA